MAAAHRSPGDPVRSTRRARIRIAVGVAGFILAMVVTSVLAVFTRDAATLRRRAARLIARLAAPPLQLDITCRGLTRLVTHRPAVFVVNHQSVAEVPVLAGCYPADSVILARTMVGRLPLVGRLFTGTGNVLIDRSGGPEVRAQLKALAARLKAERGAVWVFAEGTRNPDGRTIQPLKKGAFHVAADADGWIVPVVVAPLYPALSRPGRTPVSVTILPPERATDGGAAAIAALADRTRTRMQQVLDAGTIS